MEDDKGLDIVEAAARLEAAAAALEAAAARLEDHAVGRITAVESERETELERRLAEAEAKIAGLTAAAAPHNAGRKTLPVGMAAMLAKSGVALDSVEAGAIDGALASLSIEQRIAVKAELLRAGLL